MWAAMTSDFDIYCRSKLSGLVAFVASVLLLAACTGLQTDYEVMKERAHKYVAAHPKLAPGTADAIRSNQVHEGMTMEQVAAAWGRPAVVQRFRGGAVQYWFFGCHWPHFCTNPDEDSRSGMFPEPDEIYQSRALFQNGKLVEWQS